MSDALDSLGIDGVMEGIPKRSGGQRIAGPALTVEEHAASLGTYEVSQFGLGNIISATPPGGVIVIAMEGKAVSTFGGLAARAAIERGIAGVVIDGACRDLGELESTGVFVASRHVTPRSAKGRVRVVSLGHTVQCGGISVHTGDYLVADETGVVVIPRERLEEIISIAERLERQDRTFERDLAAGGDFGSVATRLWNTASGDDSVRERSSASARRRRSGGHSRSSGSP